MIEKGQCPIQKGPAGVKKGQHRPVDSVHIERMTDDLYWMLIMKDGQGQRIIIGSANGRSKVVARTEPD